MCGSQKNRSKHTGHLNERIDVNRSLTGMVKVASNLYLSSVLQDFNHSDSTVFSKKITIVLLPTQVIFMRSLV